MVKRSAGGFTFVKNFEGIKKIVCDIREMHYRMEEFRADIIRSSHQIHFCGLQSNTQEHTETTGYAVP